MTVLHGVIPAVLTPFDAAGEVDVARLRRYVDWLIGHGVHGLYPCGTTGEGPLLTAAQRRLVLEAVLAAAGGRVPVVPMTGCISTAETIELTRHAQAAGAAGAAIVTPWYYPLDEAALFRHFARVAEAVPDFDLYLYNIPGHAGNAITPALAARVVAEYPQYRGIKDSSKRFELLQAFLAALPGRAVITGSDAMLCDALAAGAAGVVSGTATAFPEVMVAIHAAWQAGRREEARDLQARADRIHAALKQGAGIHSYKLAARWRGVDLGDMRPPLRPCTPEEEHRIREALVALGALP